MSKTILFFGNERLATAVTTTAPTLQALVEAGYKIEAVIANHEDPISRQKRDLEIGTIAHSYDIPVILPGKEISLIDKIKKHPADAAVLVAFGKIIPQQIIDLFPKGIINIHPSLLPLHRGSTPIESVILEGAKETGVSIMRLSAGMDSGPVYAQVKLNLTGTETKQELADKLLLLGCDLLIKNLPSILNDAIEPTPQDDTMASYDSLISKEDGIIDTNKSAEQLEREVRAYFGWPGSQINIGQYKLIVKKAHVSETTNSPLDIKCGDGKYLSIDELIAQSGKTMTASNFLNGYKI